MLSFILNNKIFKTNENPASVLLDFIRKTAKLPGTKEACREGECGACTVLVGKLLDNNIMEYRACASCVLPIGDIENCHIVTVEGVSSENLNKIQEFIIKHNASQCGYCTPGIVLSLTGFALTSETMNYNDVLTALDGNICRCTGYASIRRAGKELSEFLTKNINKSDNRINKLIDLNILPEYFLTIPDKIKKLSDNKSNDTFSKDSVIVAGGTDLFVQQPIELQNKKLYFLSQRKDLDYIKQKNDYINIGGKVTIEKFRNSDIVKNIFPGIQKDLLLHSSTILRNKATITGNIVNASPIADMSIILLVFNTELIIQDTENKKRSVKLNEFYKGYKEYDLKDNEIIKEIKVSTPKEKFFYNFEKVSNRKTLDIAAVNSAIYLTLENNTIKELNISAGGVAPIPLLIKGLDKFENIKITDKTITEIAEYVMSSVKPIDDVRGTAKYKKLLLKQLVIAHFQVLTS